MKAALLSKCSLYEFEKSKPLAFSADALGMVFAQDPAAVERTKRIFERLDAVAWNEEQSRKKLAEYVSDPRGLRTELA